MSSIYERHKCETYIKPMHCRVTQRVTLTRIMQKKKYHKPVFAYFETTYQIAPHRKNYGINNHFHSYKQWFHFFAFNMACAENYHR